MPTMSKLFGAICLAGLGYGVAILIAAHLPEEQKPGYLFVVSVLMGIIIGWRFLGKRGGDGTSSAIGSGISAMLFLVVSSLFALAVIEMLRRALKKVYDGPISAIEGVFEICTEFAPYMFHSDVIGALAIGGVLCGLIVEFIGKRWS